MKLLKKFLGAFLRRNFSSKSLDKLSQNCPLCRVALDQSEKTEGEKP